MQKPNNPAELLHVVVGW